MSALAAAVEPVKALRVSPEYLATRLEWPPGRHGEAKPERVTPGLVFVRHLAFAGPAGLEQLTRAIREGIRRAKATKEAA